MHAQSMTKQKPIIYQSAQRVLPWPLIFILLLSICLNTLGITWGLPNYADWAPDTIVPFDMLQAIYQRFSNGWSAYYPPVHFVILAICNAPYMIYLLLSGGLQDPNPLFPFGLADPLGALTRVILISRFISALMGVAIIFLIYQIVRNLFDRRSALFSSLIVALYYPLVYYAHNANVDVPYIFWSMLAIYFFLHVLKQGYLKHYVFFSLFATIAICTKDQAYGLFLLAPLPVLWMRFSEASDVTGLSARVKRILLDNRLLIGLTVAVVTFIVAQNLLFNFSGFLKHVEVITGIGKAIMKPTRRLS